MPSRSLAVACASLLLPVHGRVSEVARAPQQKAFQLKLDASSGTGYLLQVIGLAPEKQVARTARLETSLQLELDTACGTSYLLQVPRTSISEPAWRKQLAVATPCGLAAAGWAVWSQLVHDRHQQAETHSTQKPTVHVSCHDAPQDCTASALPRWWFAVAFMVLVTGMIAGRRKRKATQAGSDLDSYKAAERIKVEMYRICTEPADTAPEPVCRSETQQTSLTQQSVHVTEPAEFFSMHTPFNDLDGSEEAEPSLDATQLLGLQRSLSAAPPRSTSQDAEEEALRQSSKEPLSARKMARAITSDRTVKLHEALSPPNSARREMKLIGTPKKRIQEIANELSQAPA